MKEFSNFLSLKRFNLVFLSIAVCSLSMFFILINESNVFAASGTLSATAIDQYSVLLTWVEPNIPDGKTIIDYEIEYKESISENYLSFNDGVSINTSAVVTGLKKGTTYDFRVKTIFSPAGKSNIGTASASTPKIDTRINPPPTIEGIGFYEIVIDDNYETNLKPEKFRDYFPYSTFSDSLDLQNYGDTQKYRKEGFYVFTHESITSINTYYGLTDKPIQLQVRLKDDESSSHVQTVVLYTDIRDKLSDKQFSDTYIAFDRYQPLIVFDPNHLFKEVKAKESIENGEYWAIFDLVFAKPMKKSDIIIEAWDDSRTPIAAKIVDAWEINETPTLLLPQQKITIPHEAASTTCQENNSCFSPYAIQIAEGSTVTWSNEDTFIHTITSGEPENGPDKRFRKVLFSEESFDYTFCCKGTYKYYCEIHPWAVGLVTVTGDDLHVRENFEVNVYVPNGSLTLQQNNVIEKQDTLHKFDITGTIRSGLGDSVTISINKPDGQITTRSVIPDNKGHFSTSILIDNTWQLGSYNISAKHQNHLIGSISFTVV